jgi:outer membrane protein TolC
LLGGETVNFPVLVAVVLAAAGGAADSTAGGPASGLAAAPAPAELPLPDALAELDRQSPALTQARARADEASGLVRQSLSALLPSVTATGTCLRNSDDARINLGAILTLLPLPPGTPVPPPVVIQPLESLTGTLAARVPLLVPTAWFELEAAREARGGAAAQAEASRSALRAALATTAHLGAAAEEAVAASERAVANAAELAASAERKVQAGTAPPLDALRARTELVRRESDLVRSRADLARLRQAAGALLGRPSPVRVLVPGAAAPEGASPAPAPPDGGALVAEALSRRPEVAAAGAQVLAAEAQVRSAWARLLPQLSATGAAFASDVPSPTGAKQGWRATLDLSWSLYDGGLRYGKRGEAEARAAGARAAEAAQRVAVAQEVQDAARDLGVAAERHRLAVEQRRLAGEAAGTARRGYEGGIASSLDVVDANDRLYLADVGLAEARARLAAAQVALERALGRGP